MNPLSHGTVGVQPLGLGQALTISACEHVMREAREESTLRAIAVSFFALATNIGTRHGKGRSSRNIRPGLSEEQCEQLAGLGVDGRRGDDGGGGQAAAWAPCRTRQAQFVAGVPL
ncbi:hypothetical protein GCM10010353_71580 [Streptomyces chryseus]|nr:hypothetical protein GCM10010353_71580 [Streptomyces chryseus]